MVRNSLVDSFLPQSEKKCETERVNGLTTLSFFLHICICLFCLHFQAIWPAIENVGVMSQTAGGCWLITDAADWRCLRRDCSSAPSIEVLCSADADERWCSVCTALAVQHQASAQCAPHQHHIKYKNLSISNVTGHQRGPKWKLRAGYRAQSLQRMSHLCQLLFCEASSILTVEFGIAHFLCACARYVRTWHSGITLTPRLPVCQILFLSCPHCWASTQRKIAYSITQSLT